MSDISPVYRRQNSAWIKKTAYRKIDGEWVLISTGREPVAYLYGAEERRLPPLPEWDKTAYPYACIIRVIGRYTLDLWSAKPVVKDNPNSSVDGYGLNEMGMRMSYTVGSFEDAQDWGEATTTTEGISQGRVAPFWTNTDLYTTDGNLYLAASDPIPIYE